MASLLKKIYRLGKERLERILPGSLYVFLIRHKIGVKYLISGGTAAAVDLGLLYFFTGIVGLWYLTSAIAAFIFSLFTSFLLHKFWTFRENSIKRMKKQFVFFTALAFLNLGMNTVLLYVAVEIFAVWYLEAQFFIMGAIALMNFIVNKTITFKHKNKLTGNILIATGIYPPDIGGPATMLESMTQALLKRGFKIKVITYSNFSSAKCKMQNAKYKTRSMFFM